MSKYFKESIRISDLARDTDTSYQHIRNIVYRIDDRRPGPQLAEKLEEVTGISKEIWMFEDADTIYAAFKKGSTNATEQHI